MRWRAGAAIALWLAFLSPCFWVVGRANFTADLSAFLPRTPTQEQQLLIDQLKSGIASRLILIGIEAVSYTHLHVHAEDIQVLDLETAIGGGEGGEGLVLAHLVNGGLGLLGHGLGLIRSREVGGQGRAREQSGSRQGNQGFFHVVTLISHLNGKSNIAQVRQARQIF